jgi:DedD protein
MDEKLKQRVVGAAVLVALGVIFIPILLNGEPPAGIKETNIPPPRIAAPAPVPARVAPAPVASQPIATAPSTKTAPAPAATSQSAPKPPPVKENLKAASLESWVIQVGSFGSEANAKQLRDKLRGANYPAFVERAVDGKESVYRVRVGPELDRTRAEKTRDAIRGKFQLNGMVMSYR